MAKKKQEQEVEDAQMQEFSLEVKRDIVDIINDSPSLVMLGDKEYVVKDMRYYSLYRICRLVMDMRKADESLDTDEKVIKALCTDLDAMCEIMAIVLCNHRFTPDDIHSYEDVDDVMSRNDKMVAMMKAKVMNSTFDTNQWAAIILGAIKSIDLSGFFFTQKIGEYAYGFTSDAEEEIGGDSITVYGSTIVADASDFLRAFTQYRLDDYLYRLSIAQIQFMAVDNTHTKYLKGTDKKAWNDYKSAYEAQQKFDNFLSGFGKIPQLKEGEEFEIPVRRDKSKNNK